ncbi:Vesicle-trafficking protein SEC22b-A [Babesia sp. Xinjiang]|uniref:Vesicle-trafficking protein SEC22b-A n=1 Tax=Babesia sp. Xinjiang TaxID=462227 RepID=UPI000A229BE5|nr:Vesicle-trafficking protein SEC22b-A [Babesia sp. Xinjiang]ORM40638.1 Vesicle-trafficking protein SEC22b-A [Babesia sp. Xinjiang]
MGDLTLICRASDGLPLVEMWEDRLTPDSIDKNSSDPSKITQAVKINARTICRTLPQNPMKCSVTEGNMCYHYIVEDGVAYMTVTPISYPKKLAFLYLADLCTAFSKELSVQLGSSSLAETISTIAKPYSFMSFDRTIHKIKANFKDPNSSKALNMINNSLNEVTNIMRRNIDEILHRGENLDDIGRMAYGLKAETLKFKTSSKILARQGLLEKYMVYVLVAIFILVCLYFAFRSPKKAY